MKAIEHSLSTKDHDTVCSNIRAALAFLFVRREISITELRNALAVMQTVQPQED